MSLPWLLEKYIPDMDNLPNLVLRLATEVSIFNERHVYVMTCLQDDLLDPIYSLHQSS